MKKYLIIVCLSLISLTSFAHGFIVKESIVDGVNLVFYRYSYRLDYAGDKCGVATSDSLTSFLFDNEVVELQFREYEEGDAINIIPSFTHKYGASYGYIFNYFIGRITTGGFIKFKYKSGRIETFHYLDIPKENY